MTDSPKPYGPFGLPVTIVITAEARHFDFFAERFDDVSMVDGRVRALWPHRRLDTMRSDYDLTLMYELGCGTLRGIPKEDWRIDWENSQLQADPLERLLEKKIRQLLEDSEAGTKDLT